MHRRECSLSSPPLPAYRERRFASWSHVQVSDMEWRWCIEVARPFPNSVRLSADVLPERIPPLHGGHPISFEL